MEGVYFFTLEYPLSSFALISQGRKLMDYKCFVIMSLKPIDFFHLFLDNTRTAIKHW